MFARPKNYVINITQNQSLDTEEVGFGALALGKLAKTGVLIPKSYVITSLAFDDFITAADIVTDISQLLEELDHEDEKKAKSVSERITQLILGANMPSIIISPLIQGYQSLSGFTDKYVAIKPSWILSPELIPTDQHEYSFLDIKGEGALLYHIKQVWAGLFSPAALLRRQHYQYSGGLSMAIIVQQMIQAEVSGRSYSVDQINSNPNVIEIEARLGITPAEMNDTLPADIYKIESSSHHLLERSIIDQEKMFLRKGRAAPEENPIISIPITSEWKRKQKLDDGLVRSLSKTTTELAKQYGHPVEIHWAAQTNNIYITSLHELTKLELHQSDLSKKLQTEHPDQEIEIIQSTEPAQIDIDSLVAEVRDMIGDEGQKDVREEIDRAVEAEAHGVLLSEELPEKILSRELVSEAKVQEESAQVGGKAKEPVAMPEAPVHEAPVAALTEEMDLLHISLPTIVPISRSLVSDMTPPLTVEVPIDDNQEQEAIQAEDIPAQVEDTPEQVEANVDEKVAQEPEESKDQMLSDALADLPEASQPIIKELEEQEQKIHAQTEIFEPQPVQPKDDGELIQGAGVWEQLPPELRAKIEEAAAEAPPETEEEAPEPEPEPEKKESIVDKIEVERSEEREVVITKPIKSAYGLHTDIFLDISSLDTGTLANGSKFDGGYLDGTTMIMRHKILPESLAQDKVDLSKLIEAYALEISTASKAMGDKPLFYSFSDIGDKLRAELLGDVENTGGLDGSERFVLKPEALIAEVLAVKKAKNAYGASNLKLILPKLRTEIEVVETKKIMNSQNFRRTASMQLFAEVATPAFLYELEHTQASDLDGVIVNFPKLAEGMTGRQEFASRDYKPILSAIKLMLDYNRQKQFEYIMKISDSQDLIMATYEMKIYPRGFLFTEIPTNSTFRLIKSRELEPIEEPKKRGRKPKQIKPV